MKRVIAICLTLVLVFSLCACGQSDKPVTEKATEGVAAAFQPSIAPAGIFCPVFSLYIPHMFKCVSESFAFGAFFCCPRSHPCKFNKEQF